MAVEHEAKPSPRSPRGGQRAALTSECHVIDDAAGAIAYWPLKSFAIRVNPPAASLLRRLLRAPLAPRTRGARAFVAQLRGLGLVDGAPDLAPARTLPDAPRPTRTLLLVSERCNLRCVYCYGRAGGDGRLMPWEIARAAVDLLVANARAAGSPTIEVGFHGGGEPTANWEVLTRSVGHARAATAGAGLQLRTSICTNGALAVERARWIAERIDSVTVSIDGPPELHDRQRPAAGGGGSFEQVARCVETLQRLGKRPAFRVTATAGLEGRLVEVYRYLTTRFDPCVVCVEPLFSCGRCETSGAAPPSADGFLREMDALLACAAARRIPVQYSGGRFEQLTDRFCGAAGENFFVTAGGHVTSCVEVSSPDDPRAGVFFYGAWDRARSAFVFDAARYRRLAALSVSRLASCRDCLARWHCAGDCLAKAPDMTALESRRNPYRCRINGEMTRLLLRRSLDELEADHGQRVSQGPC